MPFAIFAVAWLILLVVFISGRGEPEAHRLTSVFGWLCILVILGCALYTMATSSIMGGVAMIGSLSFFTVKKEKEDPPLKKS